MRTTFFSVLLTVITGSILLVSCQKEIDDSSGGGGGILPPANQKPKLGTRWEYLYASYYSNGSLRENHIVTYKAASEETLGGENWLRIIDETTLATVYYLKVKTDGLYQYTNNNPYLFCKDPATLNDTYTSYNDGGAEDFTVKGIKTTIVTGVPNTEVNYYEGVKNTLVIDKIWYNDKLWLAQHYLYVKASPISPYFRYSSMVLQNIYY